MALQQGARGERVRSLQEQLRGRGFDPGSVDGLFGPATAAALLAFQRSEGLLADAIAGPESLGALALEVQPQDGRSDATALFTPELVAAMFSAATPRANIRTHLPHVLSAMRSVGLSDREMVLMALATIRAETEGFEPIDEFRSRYNTPPGGPPFALYDHRADLGNRGPRDGADFKGRGFIQLTGRSNYREIGDQIGVNLEAEPARANEPGIAALILATFLKNRQRRIRAALLIDDLSEARRAVNGGSHGLEAFTAAYRSGQRLTGALVVRPAASASSPSPPIPPGDATPLSAGPSPAVAAFPRSQQVGAQLNACDTGLIQGLNQQVLDMLITMRPEVLCRIDHPLIDCRGSQNNPYLQKAAWRALVQAVEERRCPLLINSALRTPMQQFLLFEQKNRGLCGIRAAAPPPRSNHNSGLAIDIEDAPGWRPFLERHGWHWIGAFDPMHFDFIAGGDDLGALQVLAFQRLWNTHHPDAAIAEDGVWGEATAACVDRSPAHGFGVGPALQRGMISTAVGRLQLSLRQALELTPMEFSADCQYGPATAKAVARFQISRGLPGSGDTDAATLRALEEATGNSLSLE